MGILYPAKFRLTKFSILLNSGKGAANICWNFSGIIYRILAESEFNHFVILNNGHSGYISIQPTVWKGTITAIYSRVKLTETFSIHKRLQRETMEWNSYNDKEILISPLPRSKGSSRALKRVLEKTFTKSTETNKRRVKFNTLLVNYLKLIKW